MNANVAIVIALVVGIVLGAIAIYAIQAGRTRRLKERFGPEYQRVVEETGDRTKAEAALETRQKRVQKYNIHALNANERTRFQERWPEIQALFVDDPARALTDADRLIGEVMAAEGYPMQEFEQQAADISVEHPVVVENYREGHLIAVNNSQGRASTEDLRKAMLHYRTLFQELIGQTDYATAERTRI
jgi:hypothetical protein